MPPCALIGDIKQSRKLDNWPQVYRTLTRTLDEVNRRFADDVLIEFKPTVGDEFQGALKTPEKAYDVYTFIKASLPVPIYGGMGIGEVEKPLEDDVGLRGTAFYRARDALELCKAKKGGLYLKSADADNRSDEIINTILRFIGVLENSWTKRQREVVSCHLLNPEYTHETLAKQFGTSRPSITQVLKAANYELISEGEDLVVHLIKSRGEIPSL